MRLIVKMVVETLSGTKELTDPTEMERYIALMREASKLFREEPAPVTRTPAAAQTKEHKRAKSEKSHVPNQAEMTEELKTRLNEEITVRGMASVFGFNLDATERSAYNHFSFNLKRALARTAAEYKGTWHEEPRHMGKTRIKVWRFAPMFSDGLARQKPTDISAQRGFSK